MKVQHCQRETEVLAAIRSGAWANPLNDALRRHVADCPVCAEVLLVARFLACDDASVEAVLPEAGLVWWKAQMRARREAAERAAQPIAIAEKVACAWGLLAAAAVIVWQWPRLAAWASNWLAGGIESTPAALAGEFHPVAVWNGLLSFWSEHPAGLAIAAAGIGVIVIASVVGLAWGER